MDVTDMNRWSGVALEQYCQHSVVVDELRPEVKASIQQRDKARAQHRALDCCQELLWVLKRAAVAKNAITVLLHVRPSPCASRDARVHRSGTRRNTLQTCRGFSLTDAGSVTQKKVIAIVDKTVYVWSNCVN